MKTKTKNWLGVIAIILVIILGILNSACNNTIKYPIIVTDIYINKDNNIIIYKYYCRDANNNILFYESIDNLYKIGDTIK